jgi:hypothetical protein
MVALLPVEQGEGGCLMPRECSVFKGGWVWSVFDAVNTILQLKMTAPHLVQRSQGRLQQSAKFGKFIANWVQISEMAVWQIWS